MLVLAGATGFALATLVSKPSKSANSNQIVVPNNSNIKDESSVKVEDEVIDPAPENPTYESNSLSTFSHARFNIKFNYDKEFLGEATANDYINNTSSNSKEATNVTFVIDNRTIMNLMVNPSPFGYGTDPASIVSEEKYDLISADKKIFNVRIIKITDYLGVKQYHFHADSKLNDKFLISFYGNNPVDEFSEIETIKFAIKELIESMTSDVSSLM